jgi:hypothetical protein
MKKHRFSILNGFIGLSVLLMFTVAIIAGQTRANLNPSVTTMISDAVLPAVDLPVRIELDLQSGQIIAVVKSPLVGHN